LGDPARAREVLGGAGFRDIALDPIEDEVASGDGRIEPTVEFLMKIGPCATLLKEARARPSDRARATLTRYFESIAENGRVKQRGATWLVRARP
jgi:hypothetical protein